MYLQHHERDTQPRASLTDTPQQHEWLAIRPTCAPRPLALPPGRFPRNTLSSLCMIYHPYLTDNTARTSGSPITIRATIPVRCQVKTQITPHTNASRHSDNKLVFDMSSLPRHTRLTLPGEYQFHTRQPAKGLPTRHHLRDWRSLP